MCDRGGGSAAAGSTDGGMLSPGNRTGAPAWGDAFRSRSSVGSTAAGAGAVQSGVQQPISSWSMAIPDSAPGMEHANEGAAAAAPGATPSDSETSMIRTSLITAASPNPVDNSVKDKGPSLPRKPGRRRSQIESGITGSREPAPPGHVPENARPSEAVTVTDRSGTCRSARS